jgi:hypothetical protein
LRFFIDPKIDKQQIGFNSPVCWQAAFEQAACQPTEPRLKPWLFFYKRTSDKRYWLITIQKILIIL